MISAATSQAVVLFAHGARDPHWRLPFDELETRLKATLGQSSLVKLAFLELMQPSLEAAVGELIRAGATAVHIVPVFLGEGGHVRRDLPEKLDALKKRHPEMRVTLHPAAGQDDLVLQAITDYAFRCALPLADESRLT